MDLLRDGDELKELRRLAASIGGFMGSENDVGVPGVDGAGEGTIAEEFGGKSELLTGKSGGAGLLDEMRRPRGGRSIFEIFPCWESENWPSFVFKVYMCTDRSELCVATNSLRGSQATPWT